MNIRRAKTSLAQKVLSMGILDRRKKLVRIREGDNGPRFTKPALEESQKEGTSLSLSLYFGLRQSVSL